MCRFRGAKAQDPLLFTLVQKIGLKYHLRGQTTNFIIDMLKLNVPTAFAIQTAPSGQLLPFDKLAAQQFEADIQEYIKKYRVKLELLARMKEIVV